MNRLLCTCGLSALLAIGAFAEPAPASPQPPMAPVVQAVKKPAPKMDQITSSEDVPVKKPAAAAPVKTAAPSPAPPVVTQKAEPLALPKVPAPAPPASKLTHEIPAASTRPAAAIPSSKITVVEAAPAKPAAPTTKVTSVEVVPVKPAGAAPASKLPTGEAVPAKPAATVPASTTVKAAPAKPAAVVPAKPVMAAPAAKAAVTAAPAAVLSEDLVFPQAKTELKRLMIGNQAGIVKVLGPNREGVSFARGIDDKNIARFSDDDCGSIFCALGIPHERLNKVAREIMINYSTLPRKEAVAFLGAVAASPHLDADTDAKAERFLVEVMETDKDVHARRQAVLALAVKHGISEGTTERVLGLFERSENLWETFPVQQYFEYHASQVRRVNNFSQLRERIAAVKSLYTPAILAALDGSKPVTVVP